MNGQLASAWGQFREAAGMAARRGDARESVARERASALEPKLSKLKIAVKSQAGLEVKRNGAVVGPGELGLEVPIDPGEQTITASAPGKKTWTRRLTVDRPGVVAIDVPELDALPRNAPPASERPIAPSSPPSKRQATIGLVVGGAGIVALGVGAAMAMHAKATYDASNDNGHCLPDNHCDAAGLSDRSDAKTSAAVATALLLAGGAATGAGAILFFTAKRGSTTIAPSGGPSSAGLVLRHTW
jgi:hypothetical protein